MTIAKLVELELSDLGIVGLHTEHNNSLVCCRISRSEKHAGWPSSKVSCMTLKAALSVSYQ